VHVRVPDKLAEPIKKGIGKYSKILDQAIKRNINESDTSNLVYDMLGEVLGYDKFLEITTEYRIRGQYADYSISIDSNARMIIEVKAVGIKLNEQHISQAVFYAANEGINWVVLTNGHTWQLYHVSFVKPIETQLIRSIDIFDDRLKLADKVKFFYLLSRDAIAKDIITKFWQEEAAFSVNNIVGILFSEGVLDKIRRDLKRLTGFSATHKEIEDKLKNYILREGLIVEPAKVPKITRKRAPAKKEAA
jgi:predicted type IV restriction endonuclease